MYTGGLSLLFPDKVILGIKILGNNFLLYFLPNVFAAPFINNCPRGPVQSLLHRLGNYNTIHGHITEAEIMFGLSVQKMTQKSFELFSFVN